MKRNNLPFIFSNYQIKKKRFQKEEKELIDKFQFIYSSDYFSNEKTNGKNNIDTNFYKIYNINNYKKLLNQKVFTPILDKNEDILKTMFNYFKTRSKSKEKKKPLYKTIFQDFKLHKSKSLQNISDSTQEIMKIPKKKLNYNIRNLNPKLSRIISSVNIQNKELIRFKSELKKSLREEKTIENESKIKKLKKRISLPRTIWDDKCEKLIKKYKQKFIKEKSIYQILKEKVAIIEKNKNKN